MKPTASNGANSRLLNILCDGLWGTSLLYFVSGLLILSFLFITVHNTKNIYKASHLNILQTWDRYGFINCAGLRFYSSPENQDRVKISVPVTFLYSAYILEKIHKSLTGRFSAILLALHNQLIVMLGGLLLALLIYRMTRVYISQTALALLLGLSSQAIYQTFPWNVLQAYRSYPTCAFILFLLLFLIVIHEEAIRGGSTKKLAILKGFAVFMMFCFERFFATFVLGSYAIYFLLFAETKQIKPLYTIAVFILPVALATLIYKLQVYSLTYHYPDIIHYGNHYTYRSGLDGSVNLFNTIKDYFNTLQYVPSYMDKLGNPKLISFEWLLFGCGLLSYSVLLYKNLRSASHPEIFKLVTTLTVAFLLALFTYSQAIVTHRFAFSPLLLIALLLSIMATVPLCIEKFHLRAKPVVGATLLFSFCYSMFQLREYAIAFPIKRGDELIKIFLLTTNLK